MKTVVSISIEDVVLARQAALLAAEFMRENAEVHCRYCEDEFAAEERVDAERFEALHERLNALIEAATPPTSFGPELQPKPTP